MSNQNQAGKGHAPRPVSLSVYQDNYESIFGRKLPSRRYTCEGCGTNWRRNNSPESRTAPPICPSCHDDIMRFKRIEKMIPKIIHLKAKYPEL